nr:LRR receptor-like serine/threonine-protein kinase EFR [Coffea arabica]
MGFWSSSLCFMILILAFNQSQGTSAARHLGNETDLLAILDFKDKISQDPNGVLSSWNNSQHHCQWQGVSCDGKHQRVSGLNLLGQDLFGYVSSHIGNLTFLKFINLRHNRFYGEIPQEVGQLTRLRYLKLTNNSFGGEIPVNLSHCIQLKVIDALLNRLGGIPFELDSLKNLEGLSFGKNNLTGEIPRSFGNLTSLRQIYLSYNNLKGPIPQELGQLTSLYSIGVDANYFLPSSIYNISTLAGISASSNILQGNLPANMGLTLPNIQDFLLGGNQIEGTIPVSLANASLLEQLELSDNMLKGQVPTNFGNLHNLQWLGIGGNILGSNSAGDLDFIASLSNSSNLQSLLFRGNNFGGKLPAFKWNSSNMLDQLDLGLNQILGEVPLWLRDLNNLYYLATDNNFFSVPIPNILGKFQMLQE